MQWIAKNKTQLIKHKIYVNQRHVYICLSKQVLQFLTNKDELEETLAEWPSTY